MRRIHRCLTRTSEYVLWRTRDDGIVLPDAERAVRAAIEFATTLLGLEQQAVVILSGQFVVRDPQGGCGFGAYDPERKEVWIGAGRSQPAEAHWAVFETADEWHKHLQLTVVHELVHFLQDCEFRLVGNEANEQEADSTADRLVSTLRHWAAKP